MARQLRVQYEGAIYHVTVRSNGEEDLFGDDVDRKYLLSHLSEEVETHGVRLYQFCLMSNHFHLLVETPRANVDRFMHGVLTGYGVYFNRRHRRHGHVTQGRYGAKLVNGDEYLRRLSRYVHLNPVKIAKMAAVAPKGKVACLREYPWSSYRGYIGAGERNKFVEYGPLLALMDCPVRKRALEYRRFVEMGAARDDEDFLRELEMSPRSIGNNRFREWVDDCYDELLAKRQRKEDVSFRRTWRKQAPEAVLAEVAKRAKVKKEELMTRRRDSVVRAVASRMLCRYAGLTQREVAEVLGLKTGAGVSSQLKRLKTQAGNNPQMQRLVAGLDRYFSRKVC